MENKFDNLKYVRDIYITEKLNVKIYLYSGELLFDIGYYYSKYKDCYYPYIPFNYKLGDDLEKYLYTIEDLRNHNYYRQDIFRSKIQKFIREWKINKLLDV